MTECERIIQQGILPSSFFEAETICDFYVDEKRKKIWAIELDLLREFDCVCKSYNLTYFLVGGSLLGAVRHKGFIPWDDDIDVAMPRNDYEKFLLLGREFSHPYFLQTCYSDEGYFFAHARLRNSNTTAIQRPFCYREFNMGIFMDILPYDIFYDNSEGAAVFDKITELIISNSTWMKLTNLYPNIKDLQRIRNYSGRDPYETYEEIQRLGKTFANSDAPFYLSSCGVVYGFEKSLSHRRDYSDIISMSFERFPFSVPVGYDNILKRLYGNYNEYPPLNTRGIWHGEMWFDPDMDYSTFKHSKQYSDWARKQY